MDFALELTNGIAEMTFDTSETIMNNVYLSLNVPKGSFFLLPEFGMPRRERMKNTAENERMVRDDALAALQWLLDTGRSTDIQIETERETSRLKLLITVTSADGNAVEYEHFVEVV